jgi:hypothetical protein
MKKKGFLRVYKICTYIVLITIILLTNNCKKSDRVQVSFTKYLQTELDSFNVNPILMKPATMEANDSLLIVLDFSTDTLFRVFSQQNIRYLGWFGKKGRGPHEFIAINATGMGFYSEEFQISDIRKIYLLNLPLGEIHDNYKIKEQYSIPSKLLTFNKIFMLNENQICGVCRSRKSAKSIDFFNTKTNEIGSFMDYPEFKIKVPENVKRSVYDYEVEVKPDRNSFAMVYLFCPLLRICNKTGTIEFESFINNLPKQIEFRSLGKKEGNLLNGITYYSGIKTTNKYIFLNYDPSQGVQVTEHRFERQPIGNKELHIFNWKGQAIARMKLIEGTTSFVPSPDNKFLFCTNENALNKIYRYDLKNLFLHNELK